MEYSRSFGSNFPTSALNLEAYKKKDVDDEVVDLVNQYYEYVLSGDMTGANTYYNENKATLDSYRWSMSDVNLLLEEVYNIALTVAQNSYVIVSAEQPVTLAKNGIWYKIGEVTE